MVRTLTERGDRVFLDLKFHDIPNTVATAVAAAAQLGVWMLNVHAVGGTAMMQAAREAAHEAAAKARQAAPPLVIAVTVLTSMNQAALKETGVVIDLMDQVLRLAELTQGGGTGRRRRLAARDGGDPSALRRRTFAIVTPGIRAADAAKDDQERTMTPGGSGGGGRELSWWSDGRSSRRDPEPQAGAAIAQQPRLTFGSCSRPSAVEARGGSEPPYFAVITKWPRRFCCQQASFSSAQKRRFLALADDLNAIGGDAEVDQVVADGGGAALAEGEVVFGGAARVGVALRP